MVVLQGGWDCLSPFFDALHGFDAVFAASEGSEPEEAFAAGPEAGAWRAYDVHFVEQLVEESPGGDAFWGLQPDVGGVDAADGVEACVL